MSNQTTKKTGMEPMISPNSKPLDVPELDEFLRKNPAGPDGYIIPRLRRSGNRRVRRPGQQQTQNG